MLPPLPFPSSTKGDQNQENNIKEYQSLLWNAGTPQQFSEVFEVNTQGVWYTTVAFLELLDLGNRIGNVKGVSSQVITISSGGAYRKDDKVFSVSYTLSKAATTHLGKMLAHFLKDWQIRSNVVAPGIFPSREPLSHLLSSLCFVLNHC